MVAVAVLLEIPTVASPTNNGIKLVYQVGSFNEVTMPVIAINVREIDLRLEGVARTVITVQVIVPMLIVDPVDQ